MRASVKEREPQTEPQLTSVPNFTSHQRDASGVVSTRHCTVDARREQHVVLHASLTSDLSSPTQKNRGSWSACQRPSSLEPMAIIARVKGILHAAQVGGKRPGDTTPIHQKKRSNCGLRSLSAKLSQKGAQPKSHTFG